MRDELLTYYERELTYIRRLAGEFADKYPGVASRLQLDAHRCEDPHVERLIEAFALLAARVHVKLDDEYPEVSQSLLQVLYPHYLRPVPSTAIVEFSVDPEQGKLSAGCRIDRHQTLYAKRGEDALCRFRTCYPVTLWPIDVAAAAVARENVVDSDGRSWPSSVSLRLRTTEDVGFSELPLDVLRFCLVGEAKLSHPLYEALLGHCGRVEIRDVTGGRVPLPLGAPALRDVGFGDDESVLPYSRRSFGGYRLLQEFLHFPEKFLFFDLVNLSSLAGAGFGRELDVVLMLDEPPRLDQSVEARNFRLGCTPVVNLFPCTAEPIRLDHARAEYRVVPDVRRQATTEVYSLDSIRSISPETGDVVEFRPFYSFKHSFEGKQERAFWHASRRLSERKDDGGTEVYLSFADVDLRPTVPPTDVITVMTTCTNRDLPATLPFGQPDGDFTLEGAAPVRRITCVTKPSKALRPPLGGRAQWRLISHLSLNYLSLVGHGDDGAPEVLREILRVYDFSDSPAVQQQIASLARVNSRHVMRRVRSREGRGLARGIEATIEFDESRLVGSGAYLFSSVLERFLGLYVSINSFSELIATTTQRGVLKRWPPRSGHQPIA